MKTIFLQKQSLAPKVPCKVHSPFDSQGPYDLLDRCPAGRGRGRGGHPPGNTFYMYSGFLARPPHMPAKLYRLSSAPPSSTQVTSPLSRTHTHTHTHTVTHTHSHTHTRAHTHRAHSEATYICSRQRERERQRETETERDRERERERERAAHTHTHTVRASEGPYHVSDEVLEGPSLDVLGDQVEPLLLVEDADEL